MQGPPSSEGRQLNGSLASSIEPVAKGLEDNDVAGGEEEKKHKFDLRLLEVRASDLAPAPPDMFGAMMSKNHSSLRSSGLQIQF